MKQVETKKIKFGIPWFPLIGVAFAVAAYFKGCSMLAIFEWFLIGWLAPTAILLGIMAIIFVGAIIVGLIAEVL